MQPEANRAAAYNNFEKELPVCLRRKASNTNSIA